MEKASTKPRIEKLGLLIATGATIAAVVSCVPRQTQYSGQPMKLDEALVAVGDALRKADEKANESGGKPTGLVPSEVVVSFNVAGTAKDEGNAGLQMTVVPAPTTTTLGAGWKGEVTSKTESNITIKYSSVLLAPATSIVGSKNSNDLAKLIEQLDQVSLMMKADSTLSALQRQQFEQATKDLEIQIQRLKNEGNPEQ